MINKRCGLRRLALAGAMIAMAAGWAAAGGPVFWEISRQDEVARGDAKGVSIAENGAITLAPDFSLIFDTKEAYIWSSAADRAGNVYLGTGHEGRVFVVDSKGAGRLLYDAAELDVTALATDLQGNVYAGTSPDGKVYKITPAGTASVFFDPEDKYIWSLLYDPSTSMLYAGTGDKGVVYKIDQAGKASTLVDTNETNVMSLAITANGELLAGTDPSGLVLRISPGGKTFAILDSPMQEIHSLAVAPDGSVFAVGVNAPAGASKPPAPVAPAPVPQAEPVITISSDDDTGEQARANTPSINVAMMLGQSRAAGRSSTEGAKGAVFRVTPDGSSEVYWSSQDAVPFCVKILRDERVLVGTGQKGRIYSIAADRSSTQLIQSPEDQTSTIIGAGEDTFATSSNLGRLYRIGRTLVSEGTYTSPVRDARFSSQWGVINWRGSGDVTMQTRSGNTETPDSTWSDWSAPYRKGEGEQITSPRARFIQWRAALRRNAATAASQTAAAPVQLQSIVVAYLPANQPPEVTSVTALPAGVALQEMPAGVDPSISSSGLDPQLFGVATTVPPRRSFQKGSRTLIWQATDPNEDTLKFSLYYRTTADNTWHLLADNLTESYYTIDGNKLPDGAYTFRVRASDSPSNPESLALTDEDSTEVIEIDNTPPSIRAAHPVTKAQTAEVMFDVTDLTSRVIRGEFSLDGGPWRLIFPIDGIADSPRESFKVKAEFQRSGEHVVAFRAADSSNNVGTSKVTVTVP
ncbi:MAG TPA: hypothetical protein VFV34_28370 [Blastocatellia bacterium]|nr:hypothetical protein [Blastocatellia bacterium]